MFLTNFYPQRSRYLNLVTVRSVVRHSRSPQGHSVKRCHHLRLFPKCHPFVDYNHPEQLCDPFVKIKTFLLLIPQLNLRCYFSHSFVGLNKLFLGIYPFLKVEVSFIKFTPYYVFVFRRDVGDSFTEFLIYIYGQSLGRSVSRLIPTFLLFYSPSGRGRGEVGIIGAIADGILASPNASISACEIRNRTRNIKSLFICKFHCKHVLTYKVLYFAYSLTITLKQFVFRVTPLKTE